MELREQATQRPTHRQDLVTIGGGATRLRRSGETVPIGFGPKVRNLDPTEVVSGERMHRVLPVGPVLKATGRESGCAGGPKSAGAIDWVRPGP